MYRDTHFLHTTAHCRMSLWNTPVDSTVIQIVTTQTGIFKNHGTAATTKQNVYNNVLQKAGLALPRPSLYIHFFFEIKKTQTGRRLLAAARFECP